MDTALEGSATMLREACSPSMKDTKSLLDIPPFLSLAFSTSRRLERGGGRGEVGEWRGGRERRGRGGRGRREVGGGGVR